MKEIEVKILDVSLDSLKDALDLLGAKQQFDGILHAFYFKSAKGDKLRIRKEGTRVFLTHKKRVSKDLARIDEESQVEVSDFQTIRKIVENLGFTLFGELKKHRISYQFENAQIEFDTFLEKNSFVPAFVEIEAQDESVLFDVVKKLGLKKEDCKPWSGNDVIKHYKKLTL